MLEIETAVVVNFLNFLKHNDLCGKLADSNVYTEQSIQCTNFRARVMHLRAR